ncbi:MAG TPA: hypothetical protein PLR41_14495, partial [Alphaproteobacteria bacterium]|nr:hypothetical protein [Alphaproteobacteria bacterium]
MTYAQRPAEFFIGSSPLSKLLKFARRDHPTGLARHAGAAFSGWDFGGGRMFTDPATTASADGRESTAGAAMRGRRRFGEACQAGT